MDIVAEIVSIIQETVLDFVTNAFGFFPTLIVGLILLLVGYIISRIVRTVTDSVLTKVGFDRVMENAGLTSGLRQVNIAATPSSLVSQLLYWMLFLNFLLAALDRMGLTAAVAPLQKFVALLPSIVVGLVVFILGSMVSQFFGKIVSGATAGMGIDFHETLGGLVRALMMCIVVIISVQQMGVDVAILIDLFVNIVTIIVIGLAIAFGLGGRSVARNALAGFYARELFVPGDTLVIDDEVGTLDAIGTLNSEVRVAGGLITVPNTRLTEENVKKLD